MKKRNNYSFKILILTAAMLFTNIAGVSYGYAEEYTLTEGAEIETAETEPTTIEAAKEPVTSSSISQTSEGSLETEPETENTVEEQKGLTENSFRYENGEWLNNEISMFSETEEDFIPWSFVDGSWINSKGNPIPGALKKGIDVSYYNKEIDWEAVKQTDISYAIIRCGYGNDQEDQDDTYWKYNADECTRLGIPFGTYIYSYALDVEEAKSEAAHVLRLIDGYELSFPIFYDLEDEKYTGSLTSEEIGDIAETFVEEMEKAGYEVVIYSSKYWFENVLTDSRFNNWEKWVAQYNYRCTYKGEYIMWQCTSSGTLEGINGPVDINFTIDPSKIEYEPETGPESEPETETEPTPIIPTPIEDPVGDFVARLYRLVLDRQPDSEGLYTWKSLLTSHEKTGAEVLEGFIDSKELAGKNLTNEAYVELLYQVCLGRSSDASGKQLWVDCLESGLSRKYVLKGFAESVEFSGICEEYEIIRGNIALTQMEDRYPEITQYLYRCYRVFLEREPDTNGLRSWIDYFVKGNNPAKITEGFVFSKELLAKELSHEEYVTLLYKGLFDRNPDSEGLNLWVDWLESGKSKKDVYWGFAGSDEFKRLVNSFGL